MELCDQLSHSLCSLMSRVSATLQKLHLPILNKVGKVRLYTCWRFIMIPVGTNSDRNDCSCRNLHTLRCDGVLLSGGVVMHAFRQSDQKVHSSTTPGSICARETEKVVRVRGVCHPKPKHLMNQLFDSMPSTHSASITFLATYLILACLYLPVHPLFPRHVRLAPVVVVPYASAVMISRVSLGHHSWPQVLAGASYGIIFAIVWFWFWKSGLEGRLGHLEMLAKAWLRRHL